MDFSRQIIITSRRIIIQPLNVIFILRLYNEGFMITALFIIFSSLKKDHYYVAKRPLFRPGNHNDLRIKCRYFDCALKDTFPNHNTRGKNRFSQRRRRVVVVLMWDIFQEQKNHWCPYLLINSVFVMPPRCLWNSTFLSLSVLWGLSRVYWCFSCGRVFVH